MVLVPPNIFINNLDIGIENLLIKCEGNIKQEKLKTLFFRTGLKLKENLIKQRMTTKLNPTKIKVRYYI